MPCRARTGAKGPHVGQGVQWPRQADEAARGCRGPPMCLARAKGVRGAVAPVSRARVLLRGGAEPLVI